MKELPREISEQIAFVQILLSYQHPNLTEIKSRIEWVLKAINDHERNCQIINSQGK